MFLPLKILHPYQRIHYATYALIALNVLVFALTVSDLEYAITHYGLSKRSFSLPSLVTSAFLHADMFHLLGNMIILVVYGRYVEERLGPARFVGTYVAFGVVANIFFVAFTSGTGVGASGCISGLLGFVLIGAPWVVVHVLFLFFVPFVFPRFDIEAFWVVGLWLLLELVGALSAGGNSRIAYAAHFGGFIAGGALAAFMRSPRCEGTDWWLDPSPPGGGPEASKRLRRARGAAARPGKHNAPRKHPPAEVVFNAVHRCQSRVAVIKLLIRTHDIDPEVAHAQLKDVERGVALRVPFDAVDAAEAFHAQAVALGVNADLTLFATARPRYGRLP